MVDFDSGETVGTPAADIVRILLLQRRDYVIEAIEKYYQLKSGGVNHGLGVVRARLRSLFLEMQAALKRRKKEEEYKELLAALDSKEIKDIEGLFYTLNEELDSWKITRLDNQKQYDSTRAEVENAAKNI